MIKNVEALLKIMRLNTTTLYLRSINNFESKYIIKSIYPKVSFTIFYINLKIDPNTFYLVHN